MAKHQDLMNKHFGRLKVIADTGRSDANGNRIWLCQCKCGNKKEVTTHDLNHEFVTSCGCLAKEKASAMGKQHIRDLVEKNCKEGTNIGNLNAKISSKNTSGVKGVTWDQAKKKWKAQIGFQGKVIFLGRFDDKPDAIAARKKAEDEYFKPILEKYKGESNDRKN
ncbi:MAG: AP2 domain-containing protein [Firmicutes bacterium HGW-Firmicutes-17]|jgi:hypothetical protein|nr:MAG: AP2 domain-containing protein [Firmicutes bacterium HGW-Firmicutes-17]